MFQLFPMLPATSAPTKSFLASNADETNRTTYTFAGASLGTAAAKRYIVVCVFIPGNVNETVVSVTVGGVSASLAASSPAGGSVRRAEIWFSPVPTGTTGDIVITMSAEVVRLAAGHYALYDINPTVYDEDTDGGADTQTASVTVPNGSIVIGAASCAAATGYTWTGLTEDLDANGGLSGSTRYSSASLAATQNHTPLAVIADAAVDGPDAGGLAVAVFQPL